MTDAQANNRHIARNTLILYFRMLLIMSIGLYTSRKLLFELGVTDYGICNVVGGLVSMFLMVSDSLSLAISRFLTYSIGKDNETKRNAVFCSTIIVQLALIILFIIISETLGLWFFNNKLNIPADRVNASMILYQLSIVSFCINLISVPYNAVIVAHEKMSAFAFISLYEASMKLAIVFVLSLTSVDKLVMFAILSCLIGLSVRMIYGLYCKRNFKECQFHFIFERNTLSELLKFSSWNFLGTSSVILRVQGGNILLNIFFGPAVNAAKGISNQVNSMLHSFVANFMTAINPQIIKSFASNETQHMNDLMLYGAKFSCFTMILLGTPFIIDIDYILHLWLGNAPEHSALFLRLIIIYTLFETLSVPIATGIIATGKIKYYEMTTSCVELLNLPLAYILFRFGFIPETITIVFIIIAQFTIIVKLYFIHKATGFSITEYLKNVYLRCIIVAVMSCLAPFIAYNIMACSFIRLVIICLVSWLSSCLLIYFLGCGKKEREVINGKAKQIYLKFKPI